MIDNKVWVVDVRTVSGYCLMCSRALLEDAHNKRGDDYGGYGAASVQWNLSIMDTLNKGHLSNEHTACSTTT